MNRVITAARVAAATLALVAGTVHAVEIPSPDHWTVETGASYLSWTSDLDRSGHEWAAPLGVGYRTSDGVLRVRFDSAFFSGRYDRKDLGAGGSVFSASKTADSTLGLTLAAPWGGARTSLAVSANLPTGDRNWEMLQRQGNLPLVLTPTRYQGRAFGLNVLGGVGRDWGAWSLSGAVGYFSSSSAPLSILGQDVDLGNYAIAGLSLARGRDFRFRIFQSMAQDTKLGGRPSYRAPSATVLESRWSTGNKVRATVEASASLFGKARREDPATESLVPEGQNSFGTRLDLSPGLEYGWGPHLVLRTGVKLQDVLRNGYGSADPLYEGGGSGIGVSQDFLWRTSRNVALDFLLGYSRLVNRDAGLTADLQLADVTYDVVTLGTRVAFQW